MEGTSEGYRYRLSGPIVPTSLTCKGEYSQD